MKFKTILAGMTMVSMLAGGAFAADKPVAKGMRGDTDNSGTLTPDEIREERRTFLLSLDANKDGKVTVEEFVTGLKKDFDNRDTNKDGVLTADEFVVYWCGKAANPKLAKVTKPLGDKHLHSHQDKNLNGLVELDECVDFWTIRFNTADTNKDGKLDKQEFEKLIREAAKRIDKNKDGIIIVDEYSVRWTGKNNSPQKQDSKK